MSSQTQGARGRFSLLGLLGQESLYLLLTASLFLNVVLTILLDSRSGPPPIINLDESQGYAFPSGEATLSADFTQNLKNTIVPNLVANADKYNATIVEVIGHTDGEPEGGGASTLDEDLLRFVTDPGDDGTAPESGDNTGLGMSRAAAVVKALRADARTRGLVFLPYSAGQAVLRSDQLASPTDQGKDDTRRRIEIRLRRSVVK